MSYQEINWTQLLRELKAAGYSTASIARELNAPYTTVDGWLHGREPVGSYAVYLFFFHQKNLIKLPNCVTQEFIYQL